MESIELLVESVLEGLDPSEVIATFFEDLFEKEKAPKDPYERAVFRIKSLEKRFDGDEAKMDQHTLLRVKKTNKLDKLKGLAKAAKAFGLKKAAKAAREKMKGM